MIPTITSQLERFKAKVQAAIDHVASGVNNLNEDQQDKAVEMLHNLGEEFYEVKDRCFEALGIETPTQRLAKAFADEAAKNSSSSVEPPTPPASPEPPVDPPADPQSPAADPSAADLDAVAAESEVKDATSGVKWSGEGLDLGGGTETD